MSPYVLVVEGEPALAEALRCHLEDEGFVVTIAAEADDAWLCIQEDQPDLILLAWNLPGKPGIELCRQLRASRRTVPIIMLAERDEEEARVRGLTTGADDYMVKPFSMAELTARINALLRRANPLLISDVLRAHDIELNRSTHRVCRAGTEIYLGATEFRLLEFLMSNPGRVYSRERLLDEVWGRDVHVNERTVDVHVGRLRKIIKKNQSDDPIRTVRGVGYAFDDRFAPTSGSV